MSKIDLIIDALLVAPPSVWSARMDEALFAARELKADATQPLANSQLYKQIVERLAEIDDDIARLRQQHLMLRVDIQILLEKRNGIRHNNVVLRIDGPDGSSTSVAV